MQYNEVIVWLLNNHLVNVTLQYGFFILLVKHGGSVVLSVSNRNQFVVSVTQYSKYNKWENLANANMKY